MGRNRLNYIHGDTGTEPTSLNFEQNGRPDSQKFDWWWYNVSQAIDAHADEFDRLDSDQDGVVDTADYANDSDKVDGKDWSDIKSWVNTNADVSNSDYADNADKVDGWHINDIKNWVNTNADVSDSDYADNADKLDGSHLSDIKNWVNSNADVPNADFADEADTLDGNHYSDIQTYVSNNFSEDSHLHDSRYYQPTGNDTFVYEVRSNDPASPEEGQAWIRDDL